MSYQAYLLLTTQLLDRNRAKISYENKEIFIDTKENLWSISSKISPSKEVSAYLSPGQKFIWSDLKTYLKQDKSTGSIYLIQETNPVSSYAAFRSILHAYFKVYNDWCNPH